MELDLETLIHYLEISVNRNGADKGLTLGHFLNLMKRIQKDLEVDDFDSERFGDISDMEGD